MHVLPQVWRGDYDNFINSMVLAGSVGACCFIFSHALYGWGHTVSHVTAGFFNHFLLLSAAAVPCSLAAASALGSGEPTCTCLALGAA